MEQTFLADDSTEHFTDEKAFRVTFPEIAAVIDSELPRRSLNAENCTFEYAHKGRLRNSLGQICTFQAKFRLTDHPLSAALIEVIELWNKNGQRIEKSSFRYI